MVDRVQRLHEDTVARRDRCALLFSFYSKGPQAGGDEEIILGSKGNAILLHLKGVE